MYEVAHKTALVTGAARRIGRAIALALAGRGMNIIVHYSQSRHEAESLGAALRTAGVQAWLVKADLRDRHAAAELLTRAAAQAGPIDVLINNAAIFPADRVTDFSAEALDLSLQLNTFAPLWIAREFAAQTNSGAIVNLLDSRVAGHDTAHATYTLSKKMLAELTALLALSLAPGIRVNAVAPGLILPPPGADLAYLEQRQRHVPLARYGSPEQVSDAVCFCVTNTFVTGQVIFVDGGSHLLGGSAE